LNGLRQNLTANHKRAHAPQHLEFRANNETNKNENKKPTKQTNEKQENKESKSIQNRFTPNLLFPNAEDSRDVKWCKVEAQERGESSQHHHRCDFANLSG